MMKIKANNMTYDAYMMFLGDQKMLYWWDSLLGSNHNLYLSSLPRDTLPPPYILVWNLHGRSLTLPRNSKSNSSWFFAHVSMFDVYANKQGESTFHGIWSQKGFKLYQKNFLRTMKWIRLKILYYKKNDVMIAEIFICLQGNMFVLWN